MIEAGVHYEPPGPLVLEGAIVEILDGIIDDEWPDIDYAIILLANPDAWSWGSCHVRPYGTEPDGSPTPSYKKDLVLENGGWWHFLAQGETDVYAQDDVEAITLQNYMADLLTSTAFQWGSGLHSGTYPILKVNLHGDACPMPEGWLLRPPGNYGYAHTQSSGDFDTLKDEFIDRLVQNNPYMRPWYEWPNQTSYFLPRYPQFTGSGFEYMLADVTLEYDEMALYEDVTDYGGNTPTPSCAEYTPVYPAETPFPVRVYSTPGDPESWDEEDREYRVTCYLDEGTTFFEDWGIDLAHATTEFVTNSRQNGTPTPTPVSPRPTPTPGGSPTPDYYRSDDLL